MAQAKREKIVYGDATDYKEDVKNGLIIPREPSKISDSLAEDVKKGRVVARPGQADTHLAHLSFSQEALLNGTATDKQEEIAKRYYVANIDAINADRKRHGLSPITVEEAVNAAKVVYEVLNNKGKESEELKKDVESGSVIYRRVNKDLEEEVLAKNVENVFITTTTTTTTRISTGPAAAPGARSGRVRRSTTEEAPAPETSGSTETTQNGGTPNKKNKGDQSSETVATELPHVAPDHSSTETGNAGEGARPSNGNGGSSITPSQPEENKGGTEAPAPVQPPSQPEDSVVTPAPETNPVQPEAPVENPTPEAGGSTENSNDPVVQGKKLSEYTSDEFYKSSSIKIPEEPDDDFLIRNADFNLEISTNGIIEIAVQGRTMYGIKATTVADPKTVFTKKVLYGSEEYYIRPEDAYDGHNSKSIVIVPKEFLDICPTTLQNYMNQSGTVYSVSNTDVTDPDAPASETSPAPTPGSSETTPSTPEAPKNNEIDYSGPNLFKQVNGDYVFLDGSEISYGGEHDNLGNLDDPYDMSKQYNIATPYNDIPMEKLVNKNIIVYGPSGEKEIFMFPDLQYMFDTEVRDNWNTTYLIRSQDIYGSGDSKFIFAIDKSSLGERPLYSLTPHELLYNGPLVNRQNDEFHQ